MEKLITLTLTRAEFRVLMDAMGAYLAVAKSVLALESGVFESLKDSLEEALADAESE